MATIYEFTVQINGNDYDPDYGWADEHYTLKEETFDTYEEACEFLRGITPEQALEWERETDCNGLDVVIWKDELVGSSIVGWNYGDSAIVGESEWIGDKCNVIDVWEVATV